MLSMVNQHQEHTPEEPASPVMPTAPVSSPVQEPMMTPPPMVLPPSPQGRTSPPPLLRVSAKHISRFDKARHRVPLLNLEDCGGGEQQPHQHRERTARRHYHRGGGNRFMHQQRNDAPPPSPRFVDPKTPCPSAAESFSISFYCLRNVLWRVIQENRTAGCTECFVMLPLALLRAGVLRLFIQKGYTVMPLHPVKTQLPQAMPLIMYRIAWNL